MNRTAEIKTSITQGSWRCPVARQSESYIASGSRPTSCAGERMPSRRRSPAVAGPMLAVASVQRRLRGPLQLESRGHYCRIGGVAANTKGRGKGKDSRRWLLDSDSEKAQFSATKAIKPNGDKACQRLLRQPRPHRRRARTGPDGSLANTTPTMSALANVAIVQSGTTDPISFTIGDLETPLGVWW